MKLCVTAADSKQINDVPGPCLVMAGAGMCNADRILHHLKLPSTLPRMGDVIEL